MKGWKPKSAWKKWFFSLISRSLAVFPFAMFSHSYPKSTIVVIIMVVLVRPVKSKQSYIKVCQSFVCVSIYEVINRHSKIIHKLSARTLLEFRSGKSERVRKLSPNMWFCVTIFFISCSLFLSSSVVAGSAGARVFVSNQKSGKCGVYTAEKCEWNKKLYHHN